MASQKQLHNAIQAAQERGWRPINGNTLAAPSNKTEIPTPESIPDRWWSQSTYKRLRSVSFLTTQSKNGGPRISAAFYREHNAPWVNPTEFKVTFKRVIEILESE